MGSVGVGSKRSISDTEKIATQEQMEIILGVANLDLGGDKKSWTMDAVMTCGLMELVRRERVEGKIFLVPKRAPADGDYSVEFMATVGWTLLIIEQDLTTSGHGVILRVAGATDNTVGVFSEQGRWRVLQWPKLRALECLRPWRRPSGKRCLVTRRRLGEYHRAVLE